MVFSLILLAPSWGGMINGIMTLSGAWHKLRTDPMLKFLMVSLSFYGMSTFEGPMMSIKTVNALSHYTDWTVGHVHPALWAGWASSPSAPSTTCCRVCSVSEQIQHRLVNRTSATIGTVGVVCTSPPVDFRGDAGPDVARPEPGWHPDLLVCRIGEGHLSVLSRACWVVCFYLTGMLLMAYNMFR